MLSNKATVFISIAIIILSFLVSAYYFPSLPERIAIHWDINGNPNGYMDKAAGVLLLPALMGLLALLFFAIPKIDPKKRNIEKFRPYFNGLVILLLVFLLAVHIETILWSAGLQVSPALLLPIGIGVLFFYIGLMLPHAEQNWFVGIRTPWTLTSESVWKKTHKIGGTLFKIAGIISILGVLSPYYSIYFVIVPVIAAAAYCVVYSYYEFAREKRRPKYVTRSS